MTHNNIIVELFHTKSNVGVRVIERLRVADRVDIEFCETEEDAVELYKTVCRRVCEGMHVPVWCFADYYEKHAELFY